MAAAGTSPALNLREKLAELAGLKQRVSPDLVRCDFTNLVTNGGFDTDTTGWTSASGSQSVVSGRFRLTDPAAMSHQAAKTPVGRYYTVSADKWTTVDTPGSAAIYLDNDGIYGSSFASVTGTNGLDETITLPFISRSSDTFIQLRQNTGTAGYVEFDNVSVYEADPSDDAPWLRLPYGYKVGQRGMIVRDGVVLHPSDYTEITDSGQTFIKPIVAPGVSTEFSIWAGA